jgi:hypothetical protein
MKIIIKFVILVSLFTLIETKKTQDQHIYKKINTTMFVSHQMKVASRAIISLMEYYHEKYHIRFVLGLNEMFTFNIDLANEILKHSSIPIEKVIFVEGRIGGMGEKDVLHMQDDLYSYVILNGQFKTLRTYHPDSGSRYRSNKFVIIDYYSPSKENTFEKVTRDNYLKSNTREVSVEYTILHSITDFSIKLYNGILYQPNNCVATQKLISVFNTTSLKWNNVTEIDQRYDNNFHGCSLKIMINSNNQYMWAKRGTLFSLRNKNETNVKRSGVSIDLLMIFLKKHNLKLQEDYAFAKDLDITIYGNPLEKILTLPSFLKNSEQQIIHTSYFGYEYLTFVISRGENFTPFEKLILPFDLTTWIMVILTFIIGYLTILILYQFPRYVQQFVFGTFNKDPSITLAQIFFGMGVVQTPNRTFARFFFIAFSLYCLVIRTAYQGKMFDFLHSQDNKRVPQNFDELFAQKIPVIMMNQQLGPAQTTRTIYGKYL